MAQSNKNKHELAELIRQSEAARAQLSASKAAFKRKIDVPTRIKGSISEEPTKWVGGSLLLGFLSKFLFGRGSKQPSTKIGNQRVKAVKKERNFLFGILALITACAKPLMRMYATKLVKNYFQSQLRGGAAARPARVVNKPL